MQRVNWRRTPGRSWFALPVALVLPMLAVVTTTLVSAAPAHAAVQTLAFEYTGGPQSWTVPAGITQATFDVYGAQGA